GQLVAEVVVAVGLEAHRVGLALRGGVPVGDHTLQRLGLGVAVGVPQSQGDGRVVLLGLALLGGGARRRPLGVGLAARALVGGGLVGGAFFGLAAGQEQGEEHEEASHGFHT